MIILASVLLDLYLRICGSQFCQVVPVGTEVLAIMTCESGDTATLGTHNWNAVSRTNDTGAFQFNDVTWQWITQRTDRAKDAPQTVQLAAFYKLWDNGYGYTHWASSQDCWSQWLEIKDGRAVSK